MSDQADPNQPYEPKPYPRMLYATADQTITVESEAEEAEARDAGYRDFEDLAHEPGDGLGVLSAEALIDIAMGLIRANLAKTDKAGLIDGIRQMRAKADAEAAKTAAAAPAPPADGVSADPAPDGFDAMDKPSLRAAYKAREGKNAPGFFDEAKLRHALRNPPPAA